MFKEFHSNIKTLMQNNNIWLDQYEIKSNKRNGGQSLCFPIKDKDKTIFIAKFFDYMKDIPNDIVQLNNQNYKCIDEFEQAIAELSISDNIETILEIIYYSKRSFNRYVEISEKTDGIFPKVYVSNENIRIKDRFYGLLIEEYVEGENLRDIIDSIDRKTTNVSQYSINFLNSVSRTLKKYSDNKIVHRDISPDNIIISNTGNVIIIDPGVIKIVDRNSTNLGYIMGKRTYASPEQYYGNALHTDFSSDLYALGIIIYEIITGINLISKYILTGKPHLEIVKNMDRELEDLFFDVVDYEDEKNIFLYSIIKKMIQEDKNLRFSNIEAFIQAISILNSKEGK